MRKNPDTSKYLELLYSRAYQRYSFEEIQQNRIFLDLKSEKILNVLKQVK